MTQLRNGAEGQTFPRYEVFKDDAGEWRWHIKDANGRVLACSGEGFHNERDCDDSMLELDKSWRFPIVRLDSPAAPGPPSLPRPANHDPVG